MKKQNFGVMVRHI